MTEKIRQYWEDRAALFKDKNSTTDDIWLRELEIRNISENLEKINIPTDSKILDVGCGDGYSTITLAEKFPRISFYGIDFSENMIKIAYLRLKEKGIKNIDFQVGNVLELDNMFNMDFDVVITDRCLINLDSIELQKKAFSKIAKVIRNDGYYIGIENFVDGHDEMNKARIGIGLSEIPIRWHNFFFKEDELEEIVSDYFKIISIKNFSSSYYFATRVIYSKMCQMKGEQPDYNHEIHQLSVDLPSFGNFSPIKMIILQKNQCLC